MSDVNVTKPISNYVLIREVLLLVALFVSPLSCCGSVFLLNTLPSSLLPPMLNVLNFFGAEARVENKTKETLYITPITMTYGSPKVIGQFAHIRQRDIPIRVNQSVVLSYDTSDAPLSGIAVCRTNNDCRLFATDHSSVYYLYSFDGLPGLESSWFSAIKAYPRYNFTILITLAVTLLPFILYSGWLYFGKLQKQRAG